MAVVSASLAKRFAAEPAVVFLDAVRQAGGPLNAAGIKQPLIDAGLAKAAVDAKWKSAQGWLKKHPHVAVVKRVSYQWSDTPVVAAGTALEVLLEPRVPQWLKQALAETVRAGLSAEPSGGEGLPRAAQERQWRIDTVRAVAELAAEVEEIAYNGADADLVLERVRTRALARALTPIGQAGQDTTFDPDRHKPLSGFPDPGSAVFVVRPGYTWRNGSEDVLIEPAVVAQG